jgi:hypothetical protein
MEEMMPFDGTGYEGRNPALDKMDKVIDLLSDERRWCRVSHRSPVNRSIGPNFYVVFQNCAPELRDR